MVRYEDPPGPHKHVRFGSNSPDLVQALKDFPGMKIGVEHAKGRKGSETPHLHVWWEGDVITSQTLRNRLSKFNPLFAEMKGQKDWSFRNHNSQDAFSIYVMENSTARVVFNHTALDLETLRPMVATVTSELQPNVHVIFAKPDKKRPMRERFIDHLIAKGWREHERNPSKEDVFKELFHFFQFAFTYPEGERMVRNAMFVFSDGPTRQSLMESFMYKYLDKF